MVPEAGLLHTRTNRKWDKGCKGVANGDEGEKEGAGPKEAVGGDGAEARSHASGGQLPETLPRFPEHSPCSEPTLVGGLIHPVSKGFWY